MKKTSALTLIAAILLCLCACGKATPPEVKIEYGKSALYTKEEMDAAIEVIKQKFSTWKGCELHSISYTSDDECNEDNLAWLNGIEAENDAKESFTQCIHFSSSFHSPKDASNTAWNEDEEYTDWGWWLARSDGGEWKLMTWGYA